MNRIIWLLSILVGGTYAFRFMVNNEMFSYVFAAAFIILIAIGYVVKLKKQGKYMRDLEKIKYVTDVERINDYAHLEGHDDLLRKYFKQMI